MAEIIFYEKPGCLNNSKQKRLLAEAGHVVIARNLLTEEWNAERLLLFFSSWPVSEWFNRSAPQVRDGDVDPDNIDDLSALMKMIEEPLLIRRPLMVIDSKPVMGFDAAHLNSDFSLGLDVPEEEIEKCPRKPGHESKCEVTA